MTVSAHAQYRVGQNADKGSPIAETYIAEFLNRICTPVCAVAGPSSGNASQQSGFVMQCYRFPAGVCFYVDNGSE